MVAVAQWQVPPLNGKTGNGIRRREHDIRKLANMARPERFERSWGLRLFLRNKRKVALRPRWELANLRDGYVMDADGSNVRRLTQIPGGGMESGNPDWSPGPPTDCLSGASRFCPVTHDQAISPGSRNSLSLDDGCAARVIS